jgi:Protein of unknown function, DUF488
VSFLSLTGPPAEAKYTKVGGLAVALPPDFEEPYQPTTITKPDVIGIGYQGRDKRLADLITALDADDRLRVVDIRFAPWSPNPDWTRENLETRLGKKYVFMGDCLGNENYRPADRHKGVKFPSLIIGISRIKNAVNRGYIPVLLCACDEADGCHRSEVLWALEQDGLNILSL